MADIELVIKIPEEKYKQFIKDQKDKYGAALISTDIIANGTPLPKGHNRLIEADSLIKAIEEKAKRLSNADTINGLCGAVALIFDAPTIIEKDKTESEV